MTVDEEKLKEWEEDMNKTYAELFKKLITDVEAYNKEHPIRVYYVHRWPDGKLSPYCVEGPEYRWTTGSIWPGSIYYAPQSDQERWVHVSAYDGMDAIEQAEQLPEWEWKPVGRSKYEDFIDIIRKKNPDVEVIPL